jgi:hypothetical protein
MNLRKVFAFVLGAVLVLTVWRAAEGTGFRPPIALQTSFDFDRYPACSPAIQNDCIAAIRFYDAASHRNVATVATKPGMAGPQQIVATIRAGSATRRVYAVTVYRDEHGQLSEGPRGETSDYGSEDCR